MKILLYGLAIILLLFGAVYVIGLMMDVSHIATVQRKIPLSQGHTWTLITNFKDYPSWRSDVRSVVVEDDNHWTEINSYDDEVKYQLEIVEAGKAVQTRIMNDDLPYGGYWTIQLARDGNGTSVTITEHGEVYNPFFRFMSKFVFGHEATMNEYLNNLSKYRNSEF